jgi:tetratricopeptide (TPR) repeat protein
MLKKAFLLSAIVLLLSPLLPPTQAQDETWTCDNGPNDVLNAAQSAYDAGDLERAYELAQTAEQVCGSGQTTNLGRYSQAVNLRLRIETMRLPTSTPAPTPPSWTCDNGPNDVLNATQTAYAAGDLNLASSLAQIAVQVCSEVQEFQRAQQAIGLSQQIQQDLHPEWPQLVVVNNSEQDLCGITITQMPVGMTLSFLVSTTNERIPAGDARVWLINPAGPVILNPNAASTDSSNPFAASTLSVVPIACDNGVEESLWDASPSFMIRDSMAVAIAPDLTILNRLDQSICQITIVPTFSSTAYVFTAPADLPSLLATGEIIPPGARRTFQLVPGTYDLQALDCAGQVVAKGTGFEAIRSGTIVVGASVTAEMSQIEQLYQQADALANAQQYQEALSIYQQALTVAQGIGYYEAEAVILNDIGVAYFGLAQYDEALGYLLQALPLRQDVADRAGEAQTLRNIGEVYLAQEQYDSALDCYTRALTIAREINDPESEQGILNSIKGIGNYYLEQGRTFYNAGQYAEALTACQKSLTIARQLGDRQAEAAALGSIGTAYWAQGQNTQALDYDQQALVIEREVGDRLGEGLSLANIGTVYISQGQYTQALDYLTQALGIMREVGDREGEGDALNSMGQMYYDQGQYAQALEAYIQALTIVREVGNRQFEGRTLINIGMVYYNQGQYAQALDYLTQALDIMREVGDRAGEGAALANIGTLYSQQGQYRQALDYNEQGLAIQREVGDRAGEAQTLTSISFIYIMQEQYAQALDYLTPAVDIRREVGDRMGEAQTLHSIGVVYYSQGQYLQALDIYTQVLVIQREVGDRAGEAQTLNNIGALYIALFQYTQALDYYTQALAFSREIGDRMMEIATSDNRGSAYEYLGQPGNAVADYQASVDIIEATLNDAALDQAITSMAAQPENSYPYQRLAVLLVQQGDLEGALNYAERGQAILTRTDLATGSIDFRAGLDQDLLTRETDLRLAVNDAQNLLDSLHRDTSATDSDIQNAQAALDDARSKYQQQLETMQLQGGFLARQITREVATLEQIQAALPADTTLILFSVGHPNSVVFLITADRLDAVVLDVTDVSLAKQVTNFASDRRANTDALSSLYTLVFAPIADRITTSRLIVVPDGPLNYVPFAALQAPDGSYLIDNYAISMVSSATTLVLLRDRTRQTQIEASSPALVLAQPSAPGLPTLRNAPLEALAVADLLGVQPNLNATEADLRAQVVGSGVLYIAAHAQLDRFAPLYSVIYLGASGEYDGRLEVREIYELDLSQGTELVVLSGCETASGGDGEDFGLMTRAFFAAGTPRVVASLWSVDDQATTDLLTTFMRERENYDNDADALRAAMLTTREQYAEPYFWASFVLSGLPE